MGEGIARCGDTAIILSERNYQPNDVREADACVFYGLEGNTPTIFEAFKRAKKAVYVDLGYWGRREGGRWAGYHKVVVNDRHPTVYFQHRPMPFDRFEHFHIDLFANFHPYRRWRELRAPDAPILLAGMGDKGAIAEGFHPEEWERQMIDLIRHHTRRPILYRPKPSWKGAKPIAGCGYSPRTIEIEKELARAWCVVTHHSNVAVDAILRGVPVFCCAGVATRLTPHINDFHQIEKPVPLDITKVGQWAADLAYTQWSIAEMRQGLPWQHLKNERLITKKLE